MKSIEILGVILFFKLSFVTSYPGGAPTSACVYLLPRHGYPNIQPQTTPSPYSIYMSSGTYTPGKELEVFGDYTPNYQRDQGQQHLGSYCKVAIKAEGIAFNGWLLQVRRVEDNMTVGRFISEPEGSKLITCNSENDAITHQNSFSFPNETLIVKWIAPDVEVGDIVLVGTVLKDYSTYWGPMKSNIVSLNPRPTTRATSSTATTPTTTEEVPMTSETTLTTTQTTTTPTTTATNPATTSPPTSSSSTTTSTTTPISTYTTKESEQQPTTTPTTTSTETTISSTTITQPTKATSPTEPSTTTQISTMRSQSTSSVKSTSKQGAELTSKTPVSSTSVTSNTIQDSSSLTPEVVTSGAGFPPDSGEEGNDVDVKGNDDTGNSSPYTTSTHSTYCLLSLLCLLCNHINILFI